ncbi:MAG: hypothetical protein CMI08_09345 [Oceanospirillaceae bacterium]|uniref:hypothetical protein n=1 Tax=unclassified Thalassolituus TaxID=2624967 RepID=UPI000C56AF42|nr:MULTISPECIES: hypothetical protein [unclassified Thalassolituus]MAS24661.1 hypothetical protein [Oceanospirillaceae bacterium]MAX99393.1 hypothetical protein [Oceanospirillaceae bacterium]MBS52998.1 hypothetical protein [Oceanospirillaceae bacterium]
MNTVAYATLYPVACPACRTITSSRASDILHSTSIECRQCAEVISLNESQLNKLRRTVADLSECIQRSAEYLPKSSQASAQAE